MTLPLLLVLAGLAAMRITRVVTGDSITEPWRHALSEAVPKGEPWWRSRQGWTHAGVECPWCVSTYVSLAVVAWLDLLVGLPLPLLWWPAVAAVAGFLGALAEK